MTFRLNTTKLINSINKFLLISFHHINLFGYLVIINLLMKYINKTLFIHIYYTTLKCNIPHLTIWTKFRQQFSPYLINALNSFHKYSIESIAFLRRLQHNYVNFILAEVINIYWKFNLKLSVPLGFVNNANLIRKCG